MLLRMLGCSLLLILVAALEPPMTSHAGQDQEGPATEPRWEYKVIKLDPYRCSSEQGLAQTLNTTGQRGWELVSYERLSLSFPRDAEGTLLIKPAATGPGKLNNPQTVDSFQGTMTMKMVPGQPPECRLLFKRQLNATAKP